MDRRLSYWDNNPAKFRIFILLMSIVLLCSVFINLYKETSTVFTGTNYMGIPSSFYIQKNFTAFKTSYSFKEKIIKKQNSKVSIPSGSFLLSVNGKSFKTIDELKLFLENISDNSELELKVFNYLNAQKLPDGSLVAYFEELSDIYILDKKDFDLNFIKFIPKGVFIGFIIEYGATFRAGLHPGDILLLMNGKTVQVDENNGIYLLTLESLRFLRDHKPGQIIPFKVLRQNQELTFNVDLASFGIQVIVLIIIICGLIFFATGLFFGLLKPQIFSARILSIWIILLGFEIASSVSVNPPDIYIFNFVMNFLKNLIGAFIYPLIFHSLNYFPVKQNEYLKNRWNLRIPYIISTVIFCYFISIVFFKLRFFDINFGIILTLLNFLYYLISRIYYSKRESDEVRKKTLFINFIFILVFLVLFIRPLLMLFEIKLDMMFFDYNFLVLLLIPVSILFITWKYRLLDINFRIRRNIQYGLIAFISNLLAVFVYFFALTTISQIKIQFPNLKYTGLRIEVITTSLDSDINAIYEKITIILIALFFSIIYFRLIKYCKEFLDKKFYRQKFDYKNMQNEIVKLFESKLKIESLAEVVIEKLSELVHLKQAGILFTRNENEIWEKKVYFFNRQKKENSFIELPDSVLSEIKKYNTAFDFDYLPPYYKNFFSENKFKTIIPIKTNEKLLGVLFIGEKLSETELNIRDIEFLISITKNCSVAIENAFLYEELASQERMKQELEIARRIQLSSLPQNLPHIKGIDISAVSIPANEVGGDFYDFLNNTPEKITVIIGDVSGKGTSAALYMSKVQGIFQTLHEFYDSPAKLLTKANHLLFRHIDSKSFVTAICANINYEKKNVSVSRAGHLPLLHFKYRTKKIDRIIPKGIGLGLCNEEFFRNSTEEILLNYETDDIFVFYSDGISESMNKKDEQFGENLLEKLIIDYSDEKAETICKNIVQQVKSFSDGVNQFDDITLVVVKCA